MIGKKIILLGYALILLSVVGCASSPQITHRASFVVNQDNTEYSQNNALYAAEVALLAYEGSDKSLESQNRKNLCYEFIDFININMKLAIVSQENQIFLAFSGTDSISDVIQDLKIQPFSTVTSVTPNKYAEIPSGHAGFRRITAELIKAGFFDKVKNSKCYSQNRPIFLSGHSLGAAVSIMMIQPTENIGKIPVAGVYLFAPPLALTNKGQDAYKEYEDRIFSFVNYKDYVSRGGYRGTYSHIGRYYLFDKNGFLRQTVPRYIKYTIFEKITFRAVQDHRLKSYIERLKMPENSDKLVQKRNERKKI